MAAPQSNPSESTSGASPGSAPEPATGRKVPIKTLLMIAVMAQPVFVAASLYYTEVFSKKEPIRCDPALVVALEAPAPLPDSTFYASNPVARKAYEEAYASSYHGTIREILNAGCNAPPLKGVPEFALPVAEEENARRNGVNDGTLAAKQLPRECLNHCWQRVLRGGGALNTSSRNAPQVN